MNDHRPADGAEEALSALQPAALSADLWDRLRAARPAVRAPQPQAHPPSALGLRAIRWLRWSAAALALILATLAGTLSIRSRPSPSDRSPPALAGARPATPQPQSEHAGRSPDDPAPRAPVLPPVFLPVQSNRILLAVRPVAFAQQPDEAPPHGMRAVVQEDLTAVGAEIDATLHLRRIREILLPARSPVY